MFPFIFRKKDEVSSSEDVTEVNQNIRNVDMAKVPFNFF